MKNVIIEKLKSVGRFFNPKHVIVYPPHISEGAPVKVAPSNDYESKRIQFWQDLHKKYGI